MKKTIFIMLLFISSIFADSWVSGWERGGISTFTLSNSNGDNLEIYCSDTHTSVYLNDDKNDLISLVDKNNMKFTSVAALYIDQSGLSDQIAFDNFLYKVSQGDKFTISMGKHNAVFNVVKNNVNNEISSECDSEKLMKMHNLLNDNNNETELNSSSNQSINAHDIYKLTSEVFYNPLLYSNQLRLDTTSLIDGLIVYEIKINNGVKGCVWNGKALADYHKKNNKPIPYQTLKQFEKSSFYFPGGCDVMKIEVFTNKGDFVHTLY